MANPILRHFIKAGTIALENVGVTPPVNRAYVGRVVVTPIVPDPITVSVLVGGQAIIDAVSVSRGGTYEQAGVVVVAGETIAEASSVNNGAIVHFFGEEVDN